MTREWNFATDFSYEKNPNGPWSYGVAGLNASMDLVSNIWIPPSYLDFLACGTIGRNVDNEPVSLWGLSYWEAGQAGMLVGCATASDFKHEWQAGWMPAWTGDPGIESVIRWTAPAGGYVSLSLRVTGQRPSGGSDAMVSVRRNGQLLAQGEIHGFAGSAIRSYVDRSGKSPEFDLYQILRVAAGDTIDIIGKKLTHLTWGGSLAVDFKVSAVDAPGVLAGQVSAALNGQHPVKGARVQVNGLLACAATGEDGRYRLELPPGKYALEASLPGASPTGASDVKIVSGQTGVLDFKLDLALLRGKITEKGSGLTLAGTLVEIDGYGSCLAGADGSYAILLPPGKYALQARQLQHAALSRKLTLAGGKLKTLNLRLEPGTLYPWPKYAGNLANTGCTESPEPKSNHPLWSFSTGTWTLLSVPAYSEGKIVAGALDGKIHALDEATGKPVWTYQTGDDVLSSPAIENGRVYVGSNDGCVYALDLADGHEIWTCHTGGEVMASPAVSDGVIYIGSQDGLVYALDAATGHLIWSHASEETKFHHLEVWSSATVVENRVYISCGNGMVYALDKSSGKTIWATRTLAFTFLSTPKVADGRVYLSAHVGWELDGRIMGLVYGLDAETGRELWTYQTGAWLYSDPVLSDGKVYASSGSMCIYVIDGATGALVKEIYAEAEHFNAPGVADGMVFIAQCFGHVVAIEEATGRHVWSKLKSSSISSAPLLANGKMIMTCSDSFIYALDMKTGREIWSYQTDGWVFCYPGIFSSPSVCDGKVYVGSGDARLYALKATTGEKIWSYKSGGAVVSSPAISDGRAYFTSRDGQLTALDAESGKKIWSALVCESDWRRDSLTLFCPNNSLGMWSSPVAACGKIFVGSWDDYLYAVNARDGSIAWRFKTGQCVSSTVALTGGRLYFGSNDGNVYALDAATGAEVWRRNVGAAIFGSVNASYGNLYVGTLSGTLNALNQVTGEIIWQYDTGGFIFGTPSAADQVVYVANASGLGVRALDAFTGREIWDNPPGPPPGFWLWTNFWSCPVVSGNHLYISNNDAHVYCFDRQTGQMAWRSERAGHEMWAIPAVADGIAYISSGDGNVYAIGELP